LNATFMTEKQLDPKAILEMNAAADLASQEHKEAQAVALKNAAMTGNNKELQAPPRDSLVLYLPPEPADEYYKQKEKAKAQKSTQLQDILDAILPPREFSERSKKWVQRVSPAPVTRKYVEVLTAELDKRLQERQARDYGICPVREEIHAQCFDELIRQVTIECPERGLLLLRVRDEIRMTLAAYQTLYQSSITFGMRKSLQAEQGLAELQAQLADLEAEKKKLQSQVQDAKGLYEALEKRLNEQRQAEEKKMMEEKEFLNAQASHLEAYLKGLSNSS